MSDELYLLDTSSLLALIDEEPGAERVEEIVRRGRFVITWVSVMEVYYITQQECGAEEADQRHALLKGFPGTLVWTLDEATLLKAARFKAVHRLSFADALIAAYAAQHHAIIVHKDPEFEVLVDQLRMEALPSKTS
ncbi:MAG: PIN domain-containing protein [Planctomycetes bacterium]|nr:PIN domain-containing protein [Planctomycetota bacterium]